MLWHEELARQRTRSNIESAEELRHWRRLRTLNRATRIERKAERRMIAAWRRAAELRATLEYADH